MKNRTNLKPLLAVFAFFLMVGTAVAWFDDVEIVPPNPTSHDTIYITPSGLWGDSCIPNGSAISVEDSNIYFDAIRDYPPDVGCWTIISPWQLTEHIGPLPAGTYTVYIRIVPDFPSYEPVAEFTVTATTYYVDAVDGNDNNDGLSPETAFATIQKGIDEANSGDTVLVAAGTYYENIHMRQGLTLQSSGADVTTIDGGENGHVVVFNLASGTISGFTITNSGSNPGYSAGIFVSQSTVTIQNNVVTNNHYGIKLSSGSNGTLAGNHIIGCTGSAAINVESSNPIITNNLVTGNNWTGIYCCQSSPSLINNTITHNSSFGILCNPDGTQVIANNIITQNEFGIFASGGIASVVPLLHISYNNVWNNSEANYWEEYGIIIIPDGGWVVSQPFTPQPGTGEISYEPLFANPNNSDYHLKSQAGRWDPNSQTWVQDAVTSPCIDAGNPGCPLGDEPNDANNVRINMGAYGGTAQASKSPANWRSIADLTNDWAVDFIDLAVFVNYWLDSGQCLPSDLNRNQSVDFMDFAIFGNHLSSGYVVEPGIIYQIEDCDLGLSVLDAEVQFHQIRFTVTVEGSYIHFEDMMTANCCPAELWLEMTLVGNLITIYEHEYTPAGCWCICDYPVTATLGPFEPGVYTLEVYEDFGGFIGSTTVIIQ